MSDDLLVEDPAPGVRLLRLNRPARLNALSKALLIELAAALREAGADPEVRAVVLTGDARAFSAGADLKEMPDSDLPPFAEVGRLAGWKTIERFPKPLVAAVNGYALGGGCELAMLCDIVVAGEARGSASRRSRSACSPATAGHSACRARSARRAP